MNSPSSPKPARSWGSAEDEAGRLCHVPGCLQVTSVGDRPGCGQAAAARCGIYGICCRATRFGQALQDRGSPSGRSPACSSGCLPEAELCCSDSLGASFHTDPTLVLLPVSPQSLPSPSFRKCHHPTKTLPKMDPLGLLWGGSPGTA